MNGKKSFFLCVLSAVFLSLSFPKFNLEFLAWVGFVPLFFALQNKNRKEAFWLFYLCGFLFFILTIYWLVHVTLTGLILLCLYLALYFAFFGYFFTPLETGHQRCPTVVPLEARLLNGTVAFGNLSLTGLTRIIFLSSLWVILEYLRSHLLTGFPWALLGYSQYLNIKIIQIADIFGSFGLSFLVMFVNLWVYKIIKNADKRRYSNLREFALDLRESALRNILILFLAFLTIYFYGAYSINKYSKTSKPALNVSLIQGNIPQEEKWESALRKNIKEIYFDLSKEAKQDNPDLIIWPETSFPDYIIDTDKNSISEMFELTNELNIPILFGSVYQGKDKYFNSAFLLKPKQNNFIIYHKIHLVPFGEYLPLRKYFSILEQFIPIEDFTEGKEFVIFKIENANKRKSNANKRESSFGVLICFEDTISDLSRQFRLKGADFLVNITNDAWFKQTSSPYQHLQASVFRAVENRVYVLRSANTGVSCVIDNCGRIVKKITGDKGRDIFTGGFTSAQVKTQNNLSLYTRFGDIIVWVCGGCVLLFGIYLRYR